MTERYVLGRSSNSCSIWLTRARRPSTVRLRSSRTDLRVRTLLPESLSVDAILQYTLNRLRSQCRDGPPGTRIGFHHQRWSRAEMLRVCLAHLGDLGGSHSWPFRGFRAFVATRRSAPLGVLGVLGGSLQAAGSAGRFAGMNASSL